MYRSESFCSFKKDLKYTRSKDAHILHKICDCNARVHKRTSNNFNCFQKNNKVSSIEIEP